MSKFIIFFIVKMPSDIQTAEIPSSMWPVEVVKSGTPGGGQRECDGNEKAHALLRARTSDVRVASASERRLRG